MDTLGNGICLSIYNYTLETELNKLPIKKGTVLVIKEPYLKATKGSVLWYLIT